MARNTEAYVDTSAFVAFVDQSDSFHPLFRRLFADPPSLVTTSLVVAEGHGWFLKRYDRSRALMFLAMLEEMPFLTILGVAMREIKSASAIMKKYADQDLTLADAVGLETMRERRSRICWSTDRHLGLTGVPLVTHLVS